MIGPIGGPDGIPWDDGSEFSGVRGIELYVNRGAITFFRAVYDLSGNPVPGPPHPVEEPPDPIKINFNFPEERITKVSGYIGIVPYATTTAVVRSITFTTNNNIYGPYGVEEGTSFSHDIPDTAFISGFVGRSSDYLNAIGFYQHPIK